MKIIHVEQDFLHQHKQHQLQQQHIHGNQLVVQLNQVIFHYKSIRKYYEISFFFLVESMCAVTEENNKKNAISECSDQRITL